MHKIIPQAHELFKNSGFDYCVCGGFALDMHAGKELRKHGDFDICVFREDKQKVLRFLQDNNWPVYARTALKEFFLVTRPGDERLAELNNMWAVKPGSFADMYLMEGSDNVYTYKIIEPRLQGFDFIEISFDERDGDGFAADTHDGKGTKITRALGKAVLYKDGIPYMAPELILFFKAHPFNMEHEYLRPKTQHDFPAVLPLLDDEQRGWLMGAIRTAYPDGFPWLEGLL